MLIRDMSAHSEQQSVIEPDEASLLPICPVCGYSLKGLPIHHRCPECGFEFDRRWQIFGGRTQMPRWRWILAISIATAALIVLVAMNRSLLPLISAFPRRTTMIWLSLNGLLLGVAVFSLRQLSPAHSFVALGPSELRHYFKKICVSNLDLSLITSARMNSSGELLLTVRRIEVLFCDRKPFTRRSRDAFRCVAAINRSLVDCNVSPDDHPNLPTSDPHRDPAVSYSESDLLPICPVCGYSLTGLPIQHRCPECGFEIDRRWLVFGGHYLSNRARTRGRVAVIAAIGMGILYVCTMAFLANRGIVFWPNFLTAICASAGPLLASLPITLVVRGDFLLITPEGVRQFQRSKCLRYTPWNEIQTARRTWVLPRIATDGPAGTRIICDMRPFGITLEGLDLCVKAINNYPRPPRTEIAPVHPT